MTSKWRVIPTEEAKKHPLYGVGGWLLFLIAGMMVIGPLLNAGRINAEILSAENQYPALVSLNEWKTYKLATWWTFAIAAALSFYGGLGLVQDKNWTAVSKAKAILWICGPVASVALGLLVPIFAFGNAQGIGVEFIWPLIVSLIGASIWTAYLSNSQRVRLTYEHSVLCESSAAGDALATRQSPSISSKPIKSQIKHMPDVNTQTSVHVTQTTQIDEEFWAKALAEYDGRTRRPGLWARVFSEADGNEALAKASYLKCRAEEMWREHNEASLTQERAELDAIEKERLSRLSEDLRKAELIPRGRCPNCDSIIALASSECPKCRALFSENGWKVLPIEKM